MHKYLGRIKKWQIAALCLLLADYLGIVLSYSLALLLRFDGDAAAIPKEYLSIHWGAVFNYGWLSLVVYLSLKLYNRNWRYASYSELMRCMAACAITVAGYYASLTCFIGRMPVSYHVFGALLQAFLLVSSRFAYRLLLDMIYMTKLKQSKVA